MTTSRFATRPSVHVVLFACSVATALCAIVAFGTTAAAGLALGAAFVLVILSVLRLAGAVANWRVRRWFNGTFAHCAAATIRVGPDGRIAMQNPAAAQLFQTADMSGTIANGLEHIMAQGASQATRLLNLARHQNAALDTLSIKGVSYRVAVSLHGTDQSTLWQFAALDGLVPQLTREATVPMARLSPNGKIEHANHAFEEVFGLHSLSTQALTDGDRLQVNTHQSLRTDTGKKDFLVIQSGALDQGAELYFFDKIEVEDQAKFDVDIFYNLPVAMLKLTREGRILGCNRAASILLGPRLSNVANFDLVFRAGERRAQAWLEEALERPPVTRWDFLQLMTDDREVILQVTLTKAETTTGEEVIFAALTDVTELKSLEAQFVQSQKMQAIGQLAGGVAHDFNNLLTAISGHCDLLLLKHDTNDPDYSDLMQIHLNTNRAASLVGQLLAFSRKQTLRLEGIDLRDSLADLAHLLNRLVGEKVELELRHHPDLRPVRADKRQLEQVVMNLVVNARDAMPDGGNVRVETDVAHFERAIERDAAIVPPGEYVIIRVIDNGVGIRPDAISHIFDPFWTTKNTGEGTGLGLSTAYGIVKQSGGFLFVESELDVGSTFEVILPVATQTDVADAPAAHVPLVGTQSPGEGTILLVEDEAPVRAFASRALQLKGYTVVEADSGEAALDTLANTDLTFDLFVTDMIMPGLDGPSWVEAAQDNGQTAKVLFMSGYAAESLQDKQKRIPDASFLAKPFSLQALTATVEKMMA